jgi:hypothetical protein
MVLNSNTHRDTTASTGVDSLALILSVARSGIANLKLYACACLVHMYRSGALPPSYASSIVLAVLPNLVKLFADSTPLYTATIQERSVRYFSLLVSDDEELQKAAMDSDAIQQLATILNSGCPDAQGGLEDLYVSEFQTKSSLWEQTEEVCPIHSSCLLNAQ